jgi:hypothetical protein
MCVAGVECDPDPRWIRLFPVPFRHLEDEARFVKYQQVGLKVRRPGGDRRPESWTPDVDSIRLGRTIGTGHGWSERRGLVAGLGEHTMCELIALNESGSGPGVPSLGVVRPVSPPEVVIEARDQEQIAKWTERADAIARQRTLFDRGIPRPRLEIVPWRFKYRYRCLEPRCRGHAQTIVDWELVALWLKVCHRSDWRDAVRAKFVDELWSPERDSAMFVGNQHQHPVSFLVLGVFWPPRQGLQTALDV